MANNILATGAVNAKGFESEAPNNFAFATWRAVPFTPDGPAVFLDGSKVPSYNGQLDASGEFAAGALIGDTSQMRPPNTRFMFQVFPVASVPPITIPNVAITSTTPQTLGALLSAQIAPLRIQAGPLVYAYSDEQIVNPVAGAGYVNTTSNTQWLFVGSGSVGMWIEVAGGGGGEGTPSGPNNAVQFNASGNFGGDGSLIYQSPNLFIGGDLQTRNFATGTASVPGKATIYSDANNTAIDTITAGGSLYLLSTRGAAVYFGPGAGFAQIDNRGNALFGGVMQVTGGVTLESTLDVVGGITTDTSALVKGPLDVTGTSALEGDASIGGNASVSGTFTTGKLATLQLLRVLATSEFDGAGTFGSTLAVIGLAALQGGLTVSGDTIVQAFEAQGTVEIDIAGKTYDAPNIWDQTTVRSFNTVYQNNTGMSQQVSATGITSGSSVGSLTVKIGNSSPPLYAVYSNENTASVSGAEVDVIFTVPPGWFYEIQQTGDITGIGRWWEWTCP